MISLPEFKVLLGPYAETLTEDEVEHLWTMEYQLADAMLEWWWQKRQEKGEVDTDDKAYTIPDIKF